MIILFRTSWTQNSPKISLVALEFGNPIVASGSAFADPARTHPTFWVLGVAGSGHAAVPDLGV